MNPISKMSSTMIPRSKSQSKPNKKKQILER